MKNLLILILVSLSFFSCSKDIADPEPVLTFSLTYRIEVIRTDKKIEVFHHEDTFPDTTATFFVTHDSLRQLIVLNPDQLPQFRARVLTDSVYDFEAELIHRDTTYSYFN